MSVRVCVYRRNRPGRRLVQPQPEFDLLGIKTKRRPESVSAFCFSDVIFVLTNRLGQTLEFLHCGTNYDIVDVHMIRLSDSKLDGLRNHNRVDSLFCI